MGAERRDWRASPSLVVSFVALFVALSGVAVAFERGAVGPKHIAENAVRSKHVKGGQLKSSDLKNGKAVKGVDVVDGTLGKTISTPTRSTTCVERRETSGPSGPSGPRGRPARTAPPTRRSRCSRSSPPSTAPARDSTPAAERSWRSLPLLRARPGLEPLTRPGVAADGAG